MIILTEKEQQKLLEEAIENGDYFDEEELYPDCTVQILKNRKTGEISVGWWKNIREILM